MENAERSNKIIENEAVLAQLEIQKSNLLEKIESLDEQISTLEGLHYEALGHQKEGKADEYEEKIIKLRAEVQVLQKQVRALLEAVL